MSESSTQEQQTGPLLNAEPGGPWEALWDKSYTHTKSIFFQLVYRFFRLVWAMIAWTLFRPKATGLENIPKKGPLLLLSNHVAMVDPALVVYKVKRTDVHFMAASTLFRIPILGPFIRSVGSFPKAKFVKDRLAMENMVKYYKRGGVVTMFPEGHRTWDGRTEPVLTGTGRLLKRDPYRIVICRNLTAHLSQPRWALYPRWVRVLLVYNKPVVVDQSLSVEEINDVISDLIRVEPEKIQVPKGSWGWRMAHGLESYLWACPSCLEVESLRLDPKDGNAIDCSQCGARWLVDVGCNIIAQKAPAQDMVIYEGVDKIKAEVVESRLISGQDSKGRDIYLSCDGARLTRRNKETGDEDIIAKGMAYLVKGFLFIADEQGQVLWERNLSGEVKAVSIELGAKVFVRIDEGLLTLRVPGQSHIKWNFFINKQLAHKA